MRCLAYISVFVVCLFPCGQLAFAQAESRDLCGAYCLYLGLKSIDLPVESLERLQEELGAPPQGGYSLGQLDAVAKKHGAHTLGVKTRLDNLQVRKETERFACIAHQNENHFVLLSKIDTEGVIVVDPPNTRLVPFVTWGRDWDGVALLMSAAPLQQEEDIRQPWNWKLIGSWTVGVGVFASLLYSIRSRLAVRGH